MAHAWQVFLHYFLIVAPWLVAAGIPSLITALTAYPKADGFVKVLKVVLNMLSVLTHADSPGTLKMPLSMSPAPSTAIELPPPVRPGMFLPFLLLGALAVSGCATTFGKTEAACQLNNLPQDEQVAMTEVTTIAAQGVGDWQGQLTTVLAGLGGVQAKCLLDAIIASAQAKGAALMPEKVAMLQRLQQYRTGMK